MNFKPEIITPKTTDYLEKEVVVVSDQEEGQSDGQPVSKEEVVLTEEEKIMTLQAEQQRIKNEQAVITGELQVAMALSNLEVV